MRGVDSDQTSGGSFSLCLSACASIWVQALESAMKKKQRCVVASIRRCSGTDATLLPTVEGSDIENYLVHTIISMTNEPYNAIKSLGGYN